VVSGTGVSVMMQLGVNRVEECFGNSLNGINVSIISRQDTRLVSQ